MARYVWVMSVVLPMVATTAAASERLADAVVYRAIRRDALNTHDWGRAIAALTRPASAGDRNAQRILGDIYADQAANAPYPKERYVDADRWYRAAAQQGDAQAAANLGFLLIVDRFSERAPDDPQRIATVNEGYAWFAEAAARGHLTSQYMLGEHALSAPHGIKPDCRAAYDGFLHAVRLGRDMARYHRHFPGDASAPGFWAASENGLGQLHETGCGVVARNHVRAMYWENKARADGYVAPPPPPSVD